jgi:hypothetical protein
MFNATVLSWILALTGALSTVAGASLIPRQRRKILAEASQTYATAGKTATDAVIVALNAVQGQRDDAEKRLAECERRWRRQRRSIP